MQLHHIEMWVKNGSSVNNIFHSLGFYKKAWKQTLTGQQHVFTNNYVDFLAICPSEIDVETESDYILPFKFIKTGNDLADTVYNVCLTVDDVGRLTETMCRYGGQCVRGPVKVADQFGHVTYSIVGTGFGNIFHTLVDKRHYTGDFLPGFQSVASPTTSPNDVTGHVDHVTYVCHPGQSDAIIDWYRKCLGIGRIHFNNASDGMVIEDNINIRLKAVELPVQSAKRPMHLVLAEPLTKQSKNHVQVFLSEHGGPGIEHVAFHTDDIQRTMVRLLEQRRLEFKEIPNSYYTMLKTNNQLPEFIDVDQLKELGILLDVETSDGSEDKSYLLQAFTAHIFQERTFFLEIIQRIGATGFGARNIINIMRAFEKDAIQH